MTRSPGACSCRGKSRCASRPWSNGGGSTPTRRTRWFTPANTRDYAAVTMPGLMYERMDETGFDFAVVYPTFGIHIAHIPGDDARRGLCRLYNEMVAEDYRPYRDRLSPVGILPLSTPEEGIEALEHAVSLGLKAFLIPSFVWRTIPAFVDAPPEYRSRLRRMDTLRRRQRARLRPVLAARRRAQCPHLRPISPAPDSSTTSRRPTPSSRPGSSRRRRRCLAKSLFLGGVLHRFPKLRVGLLEGGVAVGVRLYGDLVSRFEKRGPEGLGLLDPRNIDTAALARLAAKYNPRLVGLPADDLVPPFAADEGSTNDFELQRCAVRRGRPRPVLSQLVLGL